MAPRVLELCSGCGGLSLGLKTAGFELAGHVESDPTAVTTYARNLTPPNGYPVATWSTPRDMTTYSPQMLAKDISPLGRIDDLFDVVAAGLPCQAFARIGRSKLGSLSGDYDA